MSRYDPIHVAHIAATLLQNHGPDAEAHHIDRAVKTANAILDAADKAADQPEAAAPEPEAEAPAPPADDGPGAGDAGAGDAGEGDAGEGKTED